MYRLDSNSRRRWFMDCQKYPEPGRPSHWYDSLESVQIMLPGRTRSVITFCNVLLDMSGMTTRNARPVSRWVGKCNSTPPKTSLMPARRAPPEPSTSSLLLREERLVQDDLVLPWRAAQHLRAEILDAMVVEREPDLQVHLCLSVLPPESCAMAGRNQLVIPN